MKANKGQFLSIEAEILNSFYSDGLFVLIDEKDGADGYNDARYVYVDRKITIQGTDGYYQYDCSLKKGWNIVYNYRNKWMTNKPSNINYKWSLWM